MSDTSDLASDPDAAKLIVENAAAGCRAWDVWTGIAYSDDGIVERVISDIRHPLFNVVLRTRFNEPVSAADIASVIGPYKARGVPMAWWMAGVSPALESLLRDAGMMAGPPTAGMIAPLTNDIVRPAIAAGVSVVEARDGARLDDWCRLTATVYGLPGFAAEAWRNMQRALPTGPGAPWRRFLAVDGDEAVAAASLLAGPRAAALADVATLPAHRRRGIASSLCQMALAEAEAGGYRIATLCASADGEGVYQRLGFRRACPMPLWIWSN